MFRVENLNYQEKEAIEKLRMRFKDILPPDLYEDSQLFYRFLKARDFNINKAEHMLREHVIWRKAHQIDNIVENFKPSPLFSKYQGTYLGEDKQGFVIRYFPAGDHHINDILGCFKVHDMVKNFMWLVESDFSRLKELNKKTGNNCVKYTAIANLDKLQFYNVAHPSSAGIVIRIASFFQDNYPETLNSFYIINAPAFYVVGYSVVKRFLAPEVIRKIRVYGRTGWKEDLLKEIDPDVLPAFLGGNRTDPDGNPRCNSFIYHGGRIPQKFYLTSADRTFKDMTQVKHITIPPGRSYEVLVEVQECGSVIRWEYEIKHKDIGFGLYFKESEEEHTEILPIYRYDTPDGTKIDSYKCQSAGTYVIIFDNTFSWLNTKEVSYQITVRKS